MTSKHRRSGTIVAKGPRRWLVRVYVGTDLQTGKRCYRSQVVRGTKTDANRLLAKLQHQKDTGRLVGRTRETVASFLESWLEKTAKQRVRERTLHDYRSLINRYVLPHLGPIPLQKLTLRHIQEQMIATLQAQGLSPRTIRLAHGVLSNALRTAVRMDLLNSNPAVNVELPRARGLK